MRAGPLWQDPETAFAPALARDLQATRWWNPEEPMRAYDLLGRELADTVRALLPQKWSWEGKRALDFGCGAGRVLRHFVGEAQEAEIHGSEIDPECVEWLQENLCPPLHVARNDERPPLPYPDRSFDLIWAFSVFTHLAESWSEWLLEMHRLLRKDGLLVASYLGGNTIGWERGQPEWDEDTTGMTLIAPGEPWQRGGPRVYHSRWWLREHWGRAFEILQLQRGGLAMPPGSGQSLAVLRPRRVSLTPIELELPGPDEPREGPARGGALRQLRAVERADWEQRHQQLAELRWQIGQAQAAVRSKAGERATEQLDVGVRRYEDAYGRLQRTAPLVPVSDPITRRLVVSGKDAHADHDQACPSTTGAQAISLDRHRSRPLRSGSVAFSRARCSPRPRCSPARSLRPAGYPCARRR